MSKEKLKLALAKLRIVYSAWVIEEAENNDVMLALSEFMELRPSVRDLVPSKETGR